MSGIACAVECGDTVQLVTGHRPKQSWDEYHHDPLFNLTAKAIAEYRGDSIPFLFAATSNVYEIPTEWIKPPEQ
jgi:hypothetical protein